MLCFAIQLLHIQGMPRRERVLLIKAQHAGECSHRWRAKSDDTYDGQRVGDGGPDAAQLGSRAAVTVPSAHNTLRNLPTPKEDARMSSCVECAAPRRRMLLANLAGRRLMQHGVT